jgi:hypothetical protein
MMMMIMMMVMMLTTLCDALYRIALQGLKAGDDVVAMVVNEGANRGDASSLAYTVGLRPHLSFYLSDLSIYAPLPSTHPSTHLSIYPSIHPPTYPSIHSSTCSSTIGEIDLFLNFACSCRLHDISLKNILVFAGSM